MTDKNPQLVKSMFADIASRYDLSNDVLSFGCHRYWEKRALSLLPDNRLARCLDLCTGTGALLSILVKKYGSVVGADFCPEMLALAEKRFPANQFPNLQLKVDDALNLSFADQSFDVVTIAYGVRNFADLNRGLQEAYRVLKPNGHLLILEFGKPRNWFAPFYLFYSKFVMPLLGKLLTGNRAAYEYLPETAEQFPAGKEFQAILNQNGFKNLKHQTYTFQIVNCYLASKH